MENEQLIRNFLGAEEYIVWKGSPEKGNLISKADIFVIPFSIMWCGFAFFWEISVISSGAPFFFMLWGLPFIAIGLYITVGRFFHMAYRRTKTQYVITNERVISICGSNISALDKNSIRKIDITMRKNGCGTIYINDEGGYGEVRFNNRRRRYESNPFIIDNVADAGKVYKLLTSDNAY